MSLPSVWRAFYTRPRTEKKVADRLGRAGIEVCLPLRDVLRQWSDRKQVVREPLFPSYLFARVDERERLAVLGDAGVVNTVHFGGRLAEVRPEEIRVLQALAELPGEVEAIARDAFPAGTDVLVTDGPLAGARGVVEGASKPLYFTVSIDAVRQAVRLQVPASWVLRTAPAPGRRARFRTKTPS